MNDLLRDRLTILGRKVGLAKDDFLSETFVGKRVIADGGYYDGCMFRDCTIVYWGSSGLGFTGCKFDGCYWQFHGAAANTLVMLRELVSTGGEELVCHMLGIELEDYGPAIPH